MKKINLIGAILAVVVVSCSSPKQEEVAPEKPIIEEGHETACVYSYQEATTQVMWVAYKYTQKTGVNGKFEDTKVEGTSTGANPSDVLNGATFEIQTGSVNSGDPTRDPKIVESFFGTLVNGGSISGSVMSVEGSETEGKVTFNLSLNGINKNVEGTYTVVDNKFEAKVELRQAVDGRRRFRGLLLGLNEGMVRLADPDGDNEEITLPVNDVLKAKLVLTDELIAAAQKGRMNEG